MCDKDEREDCPKLCSREDGCNYPFIRSDEFKTNCDVTIAEYIDPFHWACCLVYGFASLLLAVLIAVLFRMCASACVCMCFMATVCALDHTHTAQYITFLWAYTIWLDLSNRHVSARVVRLQKTKMYMNTFICVGCVINLVACVDLKSYGNRIPLVATEVLSDVSIALFCCALFFMITLVSTHTHAMSHRTITQCSLRRPQSPFTVHIRVCLCMQCSRVRGAQWVDAIGMGGLSLWARRNKTALPFACATVCVLRIVLGILQWLLAPQGERSYSGTINVVKLTLTVLAAVTYSAVGLYASIYAPSADADARRSEDMEGGDRAGGPWAAAMGVLKMTRQRQVLHQRYL